MTTMDYDVKINMVVSQTSYTVDEAKELLEITNGDYVKIVMDYLKKDKGVDEPVVSKKQSINQCIYKHIRDKMNENMDVVIARMNGTQDN